MSLGTEGFGGAQAAASYVVGHGRDAWKDLTPHPVRRWIARGFDFYLTTGFVFAVLATPWLLSGASTRDAAVVFIGLVYLVPPLRGLVTAVLNALMLSAFGSTPGKWLCGVKIAHKDGGRPTFATALRRELAALVLGCGLYIPLLGLAAMAIGFSNLREKGATSWDVHRDLLVLQRPNSVGQFMLASLAFTLLMVVLAALAAIALALKGAAG
jgi:uncharacterized RDD family membrane protein YckC